MNANVDPSQDITHISLCAGYGGIDLGLKRAIGNLRTVAFSEIEAFACANLVSKMEAGLLDSAPIWTNLKTFPWQDFRGKVDVLSGGYPCQPFSAAGKRAGKDDPRHLWPYIADGIRILRPSVCFFENVEGHISLGLSDVIEDLASMGYRTTWGIFSAVEVGAPHRRKRVFILAHRIGEGLERYTGNGDGSHQPGRIDTQPDGHAGAGGLPAWPSRPGEPQHEWEPPRVVNATGTRCDRTQQHTEGNPRIETRLSVSGAGREDLGDAPLRQDDGREPGDVAAAERQGSGGDHAARDAGESMGDTESRGLGILRDASRQGRGRHADGADEDLADAEDHYRRSGESKPQARAWPHGVRGRGFASGGPDDQRQAQPALGGDLDGPAGRMGYAELQVSCDNRTDELRLLGNGVVPATAHKAFLTLIQEFTTNETITKTATS